MVSTNRHRNAKADMIFRHLLHVNMRYTVADVAKFEHTRVTDEQELDETMQLVSDVVETRILKLGTTAARATTWETRRLERAVLKSEGVMHVQVVMLPSHDDYPTVDLDCVI